MRATFDELKLPACQRLPSAGTIVVGESKGAGNGWDDVVGIRTSPKLPFSFPYGASQLSALGKLSPLLSFRKDRKILVPVMNA